MISRMTGAFRSSGAFYPLLVCLVVWGHGVGLAAQVTWTRVEQFDERFDAGAAHDVARGRVVLFGGQAPHQQYLDETLEWDGNRWLVQDPGTRPAGRFGQAMAYDAARRRTVLFGGLGAGGPLGDTWEWDGSDWTRMSSPTAPRGRYDHAMAYDSVRQVVVLFGGSTSASQFSYDDETWEWDGTHWTRRMPATSPPARAFHAMTHDSSRGRIVLFGGSEVSGQVSDTWEWDGTTWEQRSSAGPAFVNAAMTRDPTSGGALLVGGLSTLQVLRWNGSGWPAVTRVSTGRAGHSIAFDDAGRLLVVAGYDTRFAPTRSTLAWDGTSWFDLTPMDKPPPRAEQALAWDGINERVLMFGGSPMSGFPEPTWLYDGEDWTAYFTQTTPLERARFGMTWDSSRREVLLFGGAAAGGQTLGDTWVWNGVDWDQRTPARPPSARSDFALCYQGARRRALLFGGRDAFGRTLDETWEWDGSAWIRRTPATSPPASILTGDSAAYDEVRERVVLVVGPTTWLWDGNDWEQVASSPFLGRTSLQWDPARQRVIGVEGRSTTVVTAEWDGASWLTRLPARVPVPRETATAFDPLRGKLVLYGGRRGIFRLGDTEEYGPVDPAGFVAFGAACGSNPMLVERIGEGAWLGETFAADVVGVIPAASTVTALLGTRVSPIALDPIGMTGCTLYVAAGIAITAMPTSGVATFRVPVPNLAVLLGAQISLQAVAPDPGANPLGLVSSNAAAVRIGAK